MINDKSNKLESDVIWLGSKMTSQHTQPVLDSWVLIKVRMKDVGQPNMQDQRIISS